MKSFAIIGSANPKSVSLQITKRLFETIQMQSDIPVEVDYFTLQDHHVNICQGCESCFAYGKCPLDERTDDSMKKLKSELLSSDVLVFVAPIYFGNISAGMKLIVDRLSYWSHLLMLHNKLGIGIIVSDGHSHLDGLNYLSLVMESLGLSIVSNIPIQRKMILDPAALNSVLSYTAMQSLNFYKSQGYPLTNRQRLQFSTMQTKIRKFTAGSEYNYWMDHGYLTYDSFDDLVKDKLDKMPHE